VAVALTRLDFRATLTFYRIRAEAALRGETRLPDRCEPRPLCSGSSARSADGSTVPHFSTRHPAWQRPFINRSSSVVAHRDANALPGTCCFDLERSLAALNHVF
jgi:hypothetical protein